MRLEAPYSGPITLTILPNPDLGNIKEFAAEVRHSVAMDGTDYTYVKSNSDYRLSLSWSSMTRYKQIELYYFVLNYSDEYVKLTDWDASVWKVRLLSEPSDFTVDRRGNPCYETSAVKLEFQGEKIS